MTTYQYQPQIQQQQQVQFQQQAQLQQQPYAQQQYYAQYQQPTVQSYVQPQLPTLPERTRRSLFGMAIALLVHGAICIIFGGIGYAIYGYGYNPVMFIGTNIWVGLFYAIPGALGIAHYRQPANEPLVQSFYAFSIIGFLFSLTHMGLSIASAVNYYVPATAIVSILLALTGLSFTLAFVIILSRGIFCVQNAGAVQGQVYGQTAMASLPQPPGTTYIAPQQLPVQANVAYNPQAQAGNPLVYPGGTMAMQSTAITTPQPASNVVTTASTDGLPPKY